MEYSKLEKQLEKHLHWFIYGETHLLGLSAKSIKECENTTLKEGLTFFLRYWFNDGKDFIAMNQQESRYYDIQKKMFDDKTATDFEKSLYYYTYANTIENVEKLVRFIIRNFKDLEQYGFIENNGTSLFGFDLGKNGTDLKQKILDFAKMENIKYIQNYGL